jgi:hypothetical protein
MLESSFICWGFAGRSLFLGVVLVLRGFEAAIRLFPPFALHALPGARFRHDERKIYLFS